MILKDKELFVKEAPDYTDDASVMFIHSNLMQNLEFPKEYPAMIQVHQEHPAMEVPLHWHPGLELIYTRNKDITIIIDGEKEELKSGEFVLISSFALHAVNPKQDSVCQDVLSITLQSRYIEQMHPEIRNCAMSAHAPCATDESRQKMCELLEQLRKNVEFPKKHFMTNKLLFEILNLLFEEFQVGMQENSLKNLAARNKMVEVLDYVESNYREPLTTQSVAHRFGYTREYFCRMFRQYGNLTFKKYLTEVRLTAAVHELGISDQGVGLIAMNHGFPDEKSFFSAFKKKYDMTPAQYRHSIGRSI